MSIEQTDLGRQFFDRVNQWRQFPLTHFPARRSRHCENMIARNKPLDRVRCGTCVERREAFSLARVEDPTIYHDPDYWRLAIGDAEMAGEN